MRHDTVKYERCADLLRVLREQIEESLTLKEAATDASWDDTTGILLSREEAEMVERLTRQLDEWVAIAEERGAERDTLAAENARHIDEKISLAEQLVESRDLLTNLAKAIEGASDIWISTDHPEFGIEITMVVGGYDVTLTNQASVLDAFVNAHRALSPETDK